jgi:ribonuclease VapC
LNAPFVLDASALLAYLHDEEGASEVAEALEHRATISAANLAEALSKLAEQGAEPTRVVVELEERGILGGLINVEPLTSDDAIAIAALFEPTRGHGLGLGDRACLALGQRLGLLVMTADRVWVELAKDVGVEVYSIRT